MAQHLFLNSSDALLLWKELVWRMPPFASESLFPCCPAIGRSSYEATVFAEGCDPVCPQFVAPVFHFFFAFIFSRFSSSVSVVRLARRTPRLRPSASGVENPTYRKGHAPPVLSQFPVEPFFFPHVDHRFLVSPASHAVGRPSCSYLLSPFGICFSPCVRQRALKRDLTLLSSLPLMRVQRFDRLSSGSVSQGQGTVATELYTVLLATAVRPF